MSKPPQISGQKLCKIIEKEGFVFIRQTGSHKIYQKQVEESKITVPIPVHSNKPLKKGTLHSILKKTSITKEKLILLMTLFLY